MKIFNNLNAIIIILLFNVVGISSVLAEGPDSFTQKDREMLIRLDERLNQIDNRFEQIDNRFEQIDKRFEQIDKRFEQVDIRFGELREDMNKRFDMLQQLMIAIVGAFAAIVAVTIGFAIWDRRTMMRKARDEAIERIEKEGRLQDLIKALREYARKNSELAEILRSFNLL